MKKDYEGALLDFTVAIEKDRNLEEAYYGRAFVLHQMGRADAAAADFGKVIGLRLEDPAAYAYRGFERLHQGHDAAAKRDFARCLSIAPGMRALIEYRSATIRDMRRVSNWQSATGQ